MSKWIHNISEETKTYQGRPIEAGTFFQIPINLENEYAGDDSLVDELTVENPPVVMSKDGSTDLPGGGADQIRYLQSNIPAEITPTAPKNEYSLLPYGMVHAHLNSSTNIREITLSEKDGDTYTYSCAVDPEFYDCITDPNSVVCDGVLSVDTVNHKITLFYGRHENGTLTLCKPFKIDFDFPTYEQSYSMWGSYFSAKDFGEDDIIRLQIVDTVGVGVALGLYTQEQFDAMGGECVLKEYDECWVHQLDKAGRVMTPDGAPAVVYAGLTARALYYPKDPTKTEIKVWTDYIVSVKDA
jgi:hypothetical protein